MVRPEAFEGGPIPSTQFAPTSYALTEIQQSGFGYIKILFRPSSTPLENSLRARKAVENKLAVSAYGLGGFLHRFDPRAQRLAAPTVDEFGVPGGGLVVPELLKILAPVKSLASYAEQTRRRLL